MNKILPLGMSLTALACLSMQGAIADENQVAQNNAVDQKQISFNFELESGIEQDSKLSVIELDQVTEQSDSAILLNAKANVKWQPITPLSLKAGYAYSSKMYQKYDDFDLSISQLSTEASYDFTAVTLGASYHLANADLADKSFLQLQQTSVYLTKLINNRYYLRLSGNVKSKRFEGRTERDADNAGMSLDSFIFFNQAKSYISFGLANENESAKTSQYDYTALLFRSRISHQFNWLSKKNKIQLGWRYLERDYSSITLEIDEKRYDVRKTSDITWQVELNQYISFNSQIEYGDYQSNLNSADYAETIASLSFSAKF